MYPAASKLDQTHPSMTRKVVQTRPQFAQLINTIGTPIRLTDPEAMAKESAKDPVISTVMRHCREGWPPHLSSWEGMRTHPVNIQLQDSVSREAGCLFYGDRLVIFKSRQQQVLTILLQWHLGMQRMKQEALTASILTWTRLTKLSDHGSISHMPIVCGTSKQCSKSSGSFEDVT
ncbi:transposon Tf2-9 polyprotein [Elysia marginata]|uniref:Transposon Tf2-9 polyprotein n=1 Tax=Elysia marginata TaxID=1093978 RepID=A0AAV4FAK1_9GAST|nr:transposon Tf2-9 polyprotein [Elysia marginata]